GRRSPFPWKARLTLGRRSLRELSPYNNSGACRRRAVTRQVASSLRTQAATLGKGPVRRNKRDRPIHQLSGSFAVKPRGRIRLAAVRGSGPDSGDGERGRCGRCAPVPLRRTTDRRAGGGGPWLDRKQRGGLGGGHASAWPGWLQPRAGGLPGAYPQGQGR